MSPCFFAIAYQAGTGQLSISSRSGVKVEMDGSSGAYSVSSASQRWEFAGNLGGPASGLKRDEGRDSAGEYKEIRFGWENGLTGFIRCYEKAPALRFRVHYPVDRPGNGVVFPQFTNVPDGLNHFSYQDRTFAPPTFGLAQTSTPWLLFDNDCRSAILSPASNFMVAKMVGDGKSLIGEGMNDRLESVPKGLDQDSVLVFANGIGQAWDAWGDLLKAVYRKKMPQPDSDPMLKSFGYWTDNGADYYYNYDSDKGYAPTLLALSRQYRDESIPLGYLQLDSWWYDKSINDPSGRAGGPKKNNQLPFGAWNRYGGLMEYRADKDLFPHGLSGFQRQLTLPLAVHSRWIDRTSPYHDRYKISGVAAIDPAWWRDTADYLASCGVICYEQDWLDPIYANSPEMFSKVGVADAFTDGMADATNRHGISMQYCMATSRFFLQGVKYSNLTTIRTSGDRFEPRKWPDFLWVSQLAAGVGVWPWCDVFKSGETGNLILSVLSGGPVGTGDAMGKEDRDNILRTCRADGVIVKPDRPIVPCDQTYLDGAAHRTAPFMASTYTEQTGIRTTFLFTFPRANGSRDFKFSPAEFGYHGSAYLYNFVTGEGGVVSPDDPVLTTIGRGGFDYKMMSPASKSGIALLGDLAKIVPTGRQRIEVIRDARDGLDVKIHFAKGERSVTIACWSPTQVKTEPTQGSASVRTGNGDGRYDVTVAPAVGSLTASIRLSP